MAWHVFEKLLEGVANYSTFIGKLWITIFFIFRIIIVASVGDTVYSDEQSAFICNTLQPGCNNVCFNRFSPISQIRFWAVQILFVGMPSVIFIVFAMHKMTSVSLREKQQESQTSHRDRRSDERHSLEYNNGKARHRRPEDRETSEKSLEAKESSNHTSLPQYDDLSQEKEKRAGNGFVGMQDSKKSSRYSNESLYSGRRLPVQVIEMEPEKKKVQKKTVFHKDGTSEVVTTPSIARACFAQTIITTIIEACFLVFQYNMYKFEVKELYQCIGDPCPKEVYCYVSRPKEKTLFLLFMYVMTALSILLNVLELIHLIRKYVCGSQCGGRAQMKQVFLQHSEYMLGNGGGYRRRRRRRHPSRHGGYPALGPFPMRHGNSFTDTDDHDSIDSDYRYYAN